MKSSFNAVGDYLSSKRGVTVKTAPSGNGIIAYNLDFDSYRSIPAVNASGLKELYSSYYRWASMATRDDGGRKKTPSMEFGTAFHMALIETDKFASAITDVDDGVLDIWCQAGDAARLAWGNEAVRAKIEDGTPELTVFWMDDDFGLCKARVDVLKEHEDAVEIIDVKTTRRIPSPKNVGLDCYNNKVDLQMSWYRRGITVFLGRMDSRMVHVFIVAVENKKPHESGVFRCPRAMLDRGDEMIEICRLNLIHGKRAAEDGLYTGGFPLVTDIEHWSYDSEDGLYDGGDHEA